jgi:hypothetical protein
MNADSPETPSISCTLASPELQARLEWIARLNAQALCEHHRNDLRLELIYASDAVESVREMAERERLCCAFLNISIHAEQDSVTVTIEVPEQGRAVVQRYSNPSWPEREIRQNLKSRQNQYRHRRMLIASRSLRGRHHAASLSSLSFR